jgi:hypothetical protein
MPSFLLEHGGFDAQAAEGPAIKREDIMDRQSSPCTIAQTAECDLCELAQAA